ncbi:putative Zn-dependent peptidase [Sediminihabitans luteus]|uniref:Putative Zn-dependent peptidase n=1 Tax=Sediminihabitans luteus TaxID=1138585 RepID=A0A2M9CQQ9_9CELL|nr:insulinase family protein [Sediminihabitans luteus]PJJ74171.1 putative Zn-dependent peptidase [Sediminihabitans luteus]GII99024.1 hypothetical protein Slu03_14020 [Sediminihabitans luteus]
MSAPTAREALDGLAYTFTHVDGVPAVLVPREGPVTAGITFRVGMADESLATSGITHLVEHLALHGLGEVEAHHNGTTTMTTTTFHVTGSPAEAAAFLTGLCASLRDLPTERLATEKNVLATESAHRGSRAAGAALATRFGARAHGLAGYGELGLDRIGPDELASWTHRWFTRENAVVFLTTTDVPEGLVLDLPSGERMPAPTARPVLASTPAFEQGAQGEVRVTAVVDRGPAASLLMSVVRARLQRDLRRSAGYSYVVEAGLVPLDREHALLALYADSLPAHQDAVVGAVVDVLAALRAGRIGAEELEGARSAVLRELDAPDVDAAILPTAACDLLLGEDVADAARRRSQILSVTLEEVVEAAGQVWPSALAQVPGGPLDWAGFAEARPTASTPVRGYPFAHVDEPGVELLLERAGFTVQHAGAHRTVLLEDVAALVVLGDGGRVVVGTDGTTVDVEPTVFEGLTADVVARRVDGVVPEHLHVHRPARDPEQVPAPRGPGLAATRARVESRRRRAGALVWALRIVALMAVVMGVLILAGGGPQASSDGRHVLTVAAVCSLVAVLVARRGRAD